MILRAAGCKRIKSGQFLIDWETKGEQAYNLKHKKSFNKRDQRNFLQAIRGIQRVTNRPKNGKVIK